MGNEWGTDHKGIHTMLTVKELGKAIKDAVETRSVTKLVDIERRGQGTLQIRISTAGRANFYYRHVTSEGKRDDYPLGTYDTAGSKGLTLEDARDRYGELAAIYRSGTKDIRDHLQNQERAKAAGLRAEMDAQDRQEAGSLMALLAAYVDYLKAGGKASAREVENTLKNHVILLEDLVGTRANALTPKDLRAIFDRLQDRGLTRALGKTRAALHSAYNLAARAEFDSTIPMTFRTFKVSINPVSVLPTFSALSKPGDRVLTRRELQHLLQTLRGMKTMPARSMLTAIYLGGQRPTQLLRVTEADIDLDRGIITLRDGKGRRTHPRLHVLPLVDPVKGWVQELVAVNGSAPSIFSSDGKTAPHPSTLSGLVHAISGGAYRLGDIRRTAETELAALGVTKDVRAQILSHELGGIQAKHYDRHQYLEEKTEALNHWIAYLEGLMAGNVIPLRGVGA